MSRSNQSLADVAG